MPDARRVSVAHVVHSLSRGGTERTLLALLRRFDRSKTRHTVITLRGAGALAASLPDHVACAAIGTRGSSRISFWRLAGALRRAFPDVIHARNTGCWWDAILASRFVPNTRLLLGFHGLDTGNIFSRRQGRVARWGLRAGARFVSVSLAGKEQLRDQVGIPASRIDVLPNGVDLRRFAPAEELSRVRIRRQLGLAPSDVVAISVGSLVPLKGHDTLIQAVARTLRNGIKLRLLLVGEGPEHGQLVALACCLGVENHVHFLGWRDDVPAVLSAADVFVCSSSSEGMSNALLEALAAGLPVVATDVGDNAAVARDGREGLIVRAGDAEMMADGLVRMSRRPAWRASLAGAARDRARSFDFRDTVNAYERYYRAAACAASSRRRATVDGDAASPRPDDSDMNATAETSNSRAGRLSAEMEEHGANATA